MPDRAYFTLITANHVLDGIPGETATLVLRQLNESKEWKRVEIPIHIRNGLTPLWKKHPDVDVAGIFVGLPTNTVRNMLLTKDLLGDKELTASMKTVKRWILEKRQ